MTYRSRNESHVLNKILTVSKAGRTFWGYLGNKDAQGYEDIHLDTLSPKSPFKVLKCRSVRKFEGETWKGWGWGEQVRTCI